MIVRNLTSSRPFAALVSIVVLTIAVATPFVSVRAEDPPSAVGPVLKLFKSGRLPPERQGTVVEMICNRGNEHDLRVVFDQLLLPEGFAPELRLKVIGWLSEAATTRKVNPTGDLAAFTKLISAKETPVRLAAIRAAAAWKLTGASEDLQKLATSSDATPELQKAAIEGLVAISGNDSKSTLLKLAAKGQPMPVRMQAIAGLVAIDLQLASEQAAAALADSSATDKPNALLNAFFDRKDGTDALAAALKKQKLTVDVAKMSLRYMYSVGRSDAGLSGVLSEAAGVASDPPPPTQEEVAKLAEEVVAKGDAERGELIFRRAELSCTRCHGLNRGGGQIGPDLSAVGGSSPVDYIVNSILNPNLAVKEQYVTKIYVLTSGKILTGVVIDSDDNRVLIRDSQGNTVTIPTADIDDEAEGKSLMPQGLTKFLTHEEVLDLAKFISELGKPGPYGLRPIPSIQRWRVMVNAPAELTADVPHLEHIRELVLSSQADQWTSAYAMFSGKLPLAELRQEKKPVTLILQGEVKVNDAGPVVFDIASTEKYQVWLDDQSFDSKPKVEANLQPGVHKITIRIDVSDKDQPTLKVDVAKPTDSTVQFEVVGGA
ncbi:MAG: HEAT repeat domain-containing protein [Pirellulaceae bacterium]|nr:HEAT repeat domain-containing protein [Pirellulaceae bacterium]